MLHLTPDDRGNYAVALTDNRTGRILPSAAVGLSGRGLCAMGRQGKKGTRLTKSLWKAVALSHEPWMLSWWQMVFSVLRAK